MINSNLVFVINNSYSLYHSIALAKALRKSVAHSVIKAIILKDYNLSNLDFSKTDFYKSFDGYIFFEFNKVPLIRKNIFKSILQLILIKIRLHTDFNLSKDTLISFDKSDITTYDLVTRCKNSILIQDRLYLSKPKNYKFDFIYTLYLGIFSLISFYKPKILYKNVTMSHIKFHKLLSSNFRVLHLDHRYIDEYSIVLPTSVNIISEKKILYFGSRFFSWEFIAYEHLQRFKTFLNYLESKFAGFELHYLPRVNNSELEFQFFKKNLNMDIIKISEPGNAEIYLLNNPIYELTLSIGSTSSRTAFQMGFNSLIIYRFLKFPLEIEAAYNQIFEGLPYYLHYRGNFEFIKREQFKNLTPNIVNFLKILNNRE